ncbi:MAG: saccharopine dehydrogenase NADP-binding domain-containing protein [Canibacter sp.]
MQRTIEEPSLPLTTLSCDSRWIVYGTGEVAIQALEAARDAGLTVVVAGRNAERIAELADEFEVEGFVATPDRLSIGTAGDFSGVLNLAGPYAETAPQIIESCLAMGMHYVDVAGEASAHRATHAADQLACEFGVTLVAGAGMGSYLTERLVHALIAELDGEPASASVIVLPSPPSSAGASRRSPGVSASHGAVMFESPWVTLNGTAHQIAETDRAVPLDPWVGFESGVLLASGDLLALGRSSRIPNLRMLAAVAQQTGILRTALPQIISTAKQAAEYQSSQNSSRCTTQPVQSPSRPRLLAEVIDSTGAFQRGRILAGSGTRVAARVAVETARRLSAGGFAGAQTAYQVLARSVALSNLEVEIETEIDADSGLSTE